MPPSAALLTLGGGCKGLGMEGPEAGDPEGPPLSQGAQRLEVESEPGLGENGTWLGHQKNLSSQDRSYLMQYCKKSKSKLMQKKIHAEQNIKILNKDGVSGTDFSFGFRHLYTPAWLSDCSCLSLIFFFF